MIREQWTGPQPVLTVFCSPEEKKNRARRDKNPAEKFCTSTGNVSITFASGSLQNFCNKDDNRDESVFITTSKIL